MLKLLANRWLIRIPGLLAVAAVVLVVGPLIAIGGWRPLESAVARWVLIALIVAGWAGRHLWRMQRARQMQSAMAAEMAQAPAAAEPDASAEELATLKERFEEALRVLKQARGGKGKLNLYDLPWYIIIGPPGSGKTTALVNSGLRFPLRERFGPEAIRGVGGTRNCDWWFSDDAILIDTAGRYTTQDSNARADQAAWLGFLNLLKKHRKRRPINGIFVAISIADLLTQSEEERRAHAAAIKQRVLELDRHFRIRFPVYVLLTKADLLAGFGEFFETLGRAEREQVWGVTFPYTDDRDASPVRELDGELDLLFRRLNERLLIRLGEERDIARRALIHGFPQQLAELRATLTETLGEIFAGSRYEVGPLLRGVYFTSGTQEGTPIDRLMGSLARTFRIDPQAAAQPAGAGKSYFITDVLQKVAFAEANLAGTNRRAELQRAWLQKGAYAAAAGGALLLIAGWTASYVQGKAYVGAVAEQTERARQLLAEVDATDSELTAVLPALDAVRALPGGEADRRAGGFGLGGLGLSQRGKLGDQAVASYRRLLSQLFLPRLMLRLEGQLRRGAQSSDYRYEALKAYLMLDSAEHYDAAAIMAFVREDWNASLGRSVTTEQRAALDSHLDALFEQRPMPLPLPLNEPLIEDTRRELLATPLEERIYGRLKREFAGDIPGFNLRDAAGGAAAELVFVRKSGRPLAEPLSGLFTKAGYQRVFEQRSEALAAELAGEAWVLGAESAIDDAERQRLVGRVRELYLNEFAALYSSALLDVALAPFATAEEAARLFSVLARPQDSPLLELLESVARETALDERDEAAGGGLAERAGGAVADAQERLRRVLGSTTAAGGAAVAAARNPVEERFRGLNALVQAADGQPRPVEHLLSLMQELYQYLTVVTSEAAGGAIPPHVQERGQVVLQQLRTAAATQPELLVRELVENAASRTAALTTGGLRTYLNELWQSGPLAVCRRAIEGRYPIAASEQTVRLDDFGQFFGYGGTMDSFFNTHLRAYVDASTSPWRVRATGNLPIQLSAAALRAFEHADVIKRTFFRAGSAEPSVAFDLRPLEMNAALGNFLLHLEGAEITYAFGPRVSTLLQWPGPNPGSEVRLEFRDRQTGATEMERLQGPWAWFRLLDRSNLQPLGGEQFEVTFARGGREVVYELTARSAFNPFALPELKAFQCPASL